MFQVLAPLAAVSAGKTPLIQRLLKSPVLPVPQLPESFQDIPLASPRTAPVNTPVEKDRVRLQVRGLCAATQVYELCTMDVPGAVSALHC